HPCVRDLRQPGPERGVEREIEVTSHADGRMNRLLLEPGKLGDDIGHLVEHLAARRMDAHLGAVITEYIRVEPIEEGHLAWAKAAALVRGRQHAAFGALF